MGKKTKIHDLDDVFTTHQKADMRTKAYSKTCDLFDRYKNICRSHMSLEEFEILAQDKLWVPVFTAGEKEAKERLIRDFHEASFWKAMDKDRCHDVIYERMMEEYHHKYRPRLRNGDWSVRPIPGESMDEAFARLEEAQSEYESQLANKGNDDKGDEDV